MAAKRRTLTVRAFAKSFKIQPSAVIKHIGMGRIEAMNGGNGKERATWIIPHKEFERWKEAGYFPRKKMPVVVKYPHRGNAELLRKVENNVRQAGATAPDDTDRKIKYHASELLRLVDVKLGELSDWAALAERAKKMI